MIFGLPLEDFTQLHVACAVVGIGAGAIVLLCMIRQRSIEIWNEIFLVATLLATISGFFFPTTSFGASRTVGVVTTIVLALGFYALYGKQLAGWWRRLYADCAVAVLYLNCLVGVIQAFDKLPALKAIAPTRSSPAVLVTQAAVLVVFFIGGFMAQRRFAATDPF
jgi:hypothetical protein